MPYVKHVRVDIDADPSLPRAGVDNGFAAGGAVAQLQSDLERRLSSEDPDWVVQPSTLPVEGVIRFFSVAGGYFLLLAGYALVTLIVFL